MNSPATPMPRPEVATLHPYEPGISDDALRMRYGITGDVIKLASNENPYGPSPAVEAALREWSPDQTSRYPDVRRMAAAITDLHHQSERSVVIGNGSNDVLDIIARTYLSPGDEAISSQYGFIVYGLVTTLCGAANVIVPARDYGHDLSAMHQAITERTKVIWIANPNNPTGTFVPSGELQEFLESVPPQVIVVLDEAYSEYLSPENQYESAAWLARFSNLVIVRTLSKIYGLAGLRLGYALAHPDIAEYLNRVRQPFNANNAALIAGEAALGDQAYIELARSRNSAGLQQLMTGLQQLGVACLPAYGNFITAQFPDASRVNEQLLQRGIIVRPLGAYDMPNFLRITVGTPEQNRVFLRVLDDVLRTSS